MIKQKLFRSFVELANSPIQSAVLKNFTCSPISRFMIPSFVQYYQINVEEMEKPLAQYKTLHELFTRHLKKEARPIDLSPTSIISPVDGTLAYCGRISSDHRFHVKNQWYTLPEMLGGFEEAKKYKNGTYMIFYLSPTNYHRIHSPINGAVLNHWILGGKSCPVNDWGVIYGERPFSKNYRHITELDYHQKKIAIVKVGALNVNSIEVTNLDSTYKKGDEVGYFSFGSTVILLFEEHLIEPCPYSLPHTIQMGEKIGELLIP